MRHGEVAGSGEPLRATLLDAGDPKRPQCERELLARGVPLPLTHRVAAASIDPTTATWFVAVRESDGTCRYGFAVHVSRSRAIPGHLLLRVERLDPAIDSEGCLVGLRALVGVGRRPWPRVLRVYVELFSRDPDARHRAAEWLRDLGFHRAERTRMYRQTAVIDLSGDEATIFGRLHKTARRNVRAVTKHALEIRTITDPGLGHRVGALLHEAFSRTGRAPPLVDWESVINLSRREPELSRVVGLFRTDADGPESLLAFEWGCMHGDHAQSVLAGSTRPPDGRVPLAYALAWDVICWARARGARYLDFGGATAGSHESGDPRGGFSDFKRSFGATMVEVGEEWRLEPHPITARLASAVARAVGMVRRARSR